MRTLIATVLTATFVAASPSSAMAERHRYNDAGADVWSRQGGTATQQPAHTDGDILLTQVQHRERRIRMFMTVDTIDADNGSSYKPALFRFALTNGRGQTKLFDLNEDNVLRIRKVTAGGYAASSCRWTRHWVNKDTGRVAVVIPRTCLRRPKAVRLQAMAFDWDTARARYVDGSYTVEDPTNPAVSAGSSPWLERG